MPCYLNPDLRHQDANRDLCIVNTALTCQIKLPPGFRRDDVLAFHRRDVQQVAERVEEHVLHKGLVWDRGPACLSFRFDDGTVTVELSIEGMATDDGREKFENMARRMLGLTQRVEEFEQRYRAHRQIGSLIGRNTGLRVPMTATPFEALCWAITGQQISVSAAVSVRRRLIQAAGLRHSSGLWCFPDSARITVMSQEALRQTGLSKTKAQTLAELSARIETGSLPLDDWLDSPKEDEIRERLLNIRGVGPWTVNYALLRGFGWLDGSLHGDVAVRRNLQVLLGRADKVGENEAKQWLAGFSPWRALVAAHLWAMKKTEGY
jgi:DNA-3-methyladenine glycosylase II